MCPATTRLLAEPEPVPKNHIRLTFGVPSELELIEGARRLAAALCHLSARGRMKVESTEERVGWVTAGREGWPGAWTLTRGP